jgi:hypothetical protein
LLLPHYIRPQGEEVQARVSVDRGKLASRRELNTLGSGMIFLKDNESKQRFMVDTGAICSVLPVATTPITSKADRPAALRR